MLNFYSVVIYGYIVLAAYLAYIFWRDQKTAGTFLNRRKKTAWGLILLFTTGIFLAFYAHLVEPWTIATVNQPVADKLINAPVRIAFVSDIQVGNHKKYGWVEKIAERIEQEKPDLVILGGDQIDNEGNTDETPNLEPLRALTKKYPVYYVLGNHEYGIGNLTVDRPAEQTGNRSAEVEDFMKNIGAKLLRNDLACLEIKKQNLCLFGIDDLWGGAQDFSPVVNCHSNDNVILNGAKDLYSSGRLEIQHDDCMPDNTPLIFITHNPDGILLWPKNTRMPDLVLAGHTHGGQVYLPFLGPLGGAGIDLPTQFYRGLNHVILTRPDGERSVPVFTSVGVGESGGAVRLGATPEIVIINLKPQE